MLTSAGLCLRETLDERVKRSAVSRPSSIACPYQGSSLAAWPLYHMHMGDKDHANL